MEKGQELVKVSFNLDRSGLVWRPEIGDEVVRRDNLEFVSIFVDPQGLTPRKLRDYFVWLPTVEQLVSQFEARQAIVYHAGLSQSFTYEAVIKTSAGLIETAAATLRLAFGHALYELLVNGGGKAPIH